MGAGLLVLCPISAAPLPQSTEKSYIILCAYDKSIDPDFAASPTPLAPRHGAWPGERRVCLPPQLSQVRGHGELISLHDRHACLLGSAEPCSHALHAVCGCASGAPSSIRWWRRWGPQREAASRRHRGPCDVTDRLPAAPHPHVRRSPFDSSCDEPRTRGGAAARRGKAAALTAEGADTATAAAPAGESLEEGALHDPLLG
jgi:hypothetical protein